MGRRRRRGAHERRRRRAGGARRRAPSARRCRNHRPSQSAAPTTPEASRTMSRASCVLKARKPMSARSARAPRPSVAQQPRTARPSPPASVVVRPPRSRPSSRHPVAQASHARPTSPAASRLLERRRQHQVVAAEDRVADLQAVRREPQPRDDEGHPGAADTARPTAPMAAARRQRQPRSGARTGPAQEAAAHRVVPERQHGRDAEGQQPVGVHEREQPEDHPEPPGRTARTPAPGRRAPPAATTAAGRRAPATRRACAARRSRWSPRARPRPPGGRRHRSPEQVGGQRDEHAHEQLDRFHRLPAGQVGQRRDPSLDPGRAVG